MRTKITIIFLVSLMIISVVSCTSSAQINWSKYKGTKVTFIVFPGTKTEFWQSLAPEFEAKTGIKVEINVIGGWELREKVMREFIAGKPTFDIFLYAALQRQYWLSHGHYLQDQMDYIKNPELTPADWDFEDFTYVGRKSNRIIVPDAAFSLCHAGETRGIWYRKDLLEKYGIPVPQTFEQLEQAAEDLTLDTNGDGKIDIYGWVSRGKGMQATTHLGAFIYGYGGAWWTADRKSAINKPETIRGIEMYGKMLREYGPPGPLEIGWMEAFQMFAAGKVALLNDAMMQVWLFEDPEKSNVVGKAGVTYYPAGPAGRWAQIELSTLGIPKARPEKTKEAAWLLIQYLCNKENMLKGLQEWGIPPTRKSAWRKYKPRTEAYRQSAEVFKKALEVGLPYANPWGVSIEKIRDIWGTVITAAIKGEPIEQLANKAAEKIGKVVAETEVGFDIPMDARAVYMPPANWATQ